MENKKWTFGCNSSATPTCCDDCGSDNILSNIQYSIFYL
jgi:hypothetical protein